jgi:pyrimidine-nucleoside phosphorylase
MRIVDIIAKKRDGQALTNAEIRWFIDAYTKGELPDYQAAALTMAILIRGMTPDEVTTLTIAMAESGQMLDLSDIADYVVDKHSSGGVGDKTSLVVLPLVASCGVPVAKMSGRGLGYSGGTLDKMEAIPGFNVNLTESQFRKQANEVGLVLAGQSGDLAPADGKLYALRDVTATVPSIPLIASSIMSKKIAAGAKGLVLDVKVGVGAFMDTLDDARELAEMMVAIGQLSGRDVVALLSDMNQPLGYAVGNALEVIEAVETMQGGGPLDFREHSLEIAAHMLRLVGQGKRWAVVSDNKKYLAGQLANGAALAKFRDMVGAQGGDVSAIDDFSKLPQPKVIEPVSALESGYVKVVNALDVAMAAFGLGAGREKKSDSIDLAVGVKVFVKVGDKVRVGDEIAIIYANDEDGAKVAHAKLDLAFEYSAKKVSPLPLFYGVVGD